MPFDLKDFLEKNQIEPVNENDPDAMAKNDAMHNGPSIEPIPEEEQRLSPEAYAAGEDVQKTMQIPGAFAGLPVDQKRAMYEAATGMNINKAAAPEAPAPEAPAPAMPASAPPAMPPMAASPKPDLMKYLKPQGGAAPVPPSSEGDPFSDDAMKKAMGERDQLMGTSAGIKGGAQLGAAIAGMGGNTVVKTPETTDLYDKLAATKLSDLNQRRETAKDKQQQKLLESKVADIPLNRQILEQEFKKAQQAGKTGELSLKKLGEELDPDSPASKAARKLYENSFGEYTKNIPDWDKVPAYDLKNYMMEPMKIIQNLNARKAQLGAKEDQNTTKRFDEAGKRIAAEIASSRSALGRNAAISNSAEKMEAMVGGRDPNTLSTREIYEMAKTLDGMLAVGMPSVTGVGKLIPKTAAGDLASINEYVSNQVKGANAKAFVDNMMKTIGREKQVAQDQISRGKSEILGSYSDLPKKDPEKWATLMRQHNLPNDLFAEKQEKSAGGKSGKVKVISPDGKVGYMPKENLEKALQQGFKQAE